MSEVIWKPHVTVAAVIERDGRFLIVEERSEGEVVFNQPAGHLEDGETLIDAAVRETLEETAWHFLPEYVTGIYRYSPPGKDLTYLRVSFSGSCGSFDVDRKLDTDIIAARWLNREELAAKGDSLRSPMVLRCIDDFLAGHRYPLNMLGEFG